MASVSCIYGLGAPEEYQSFVVFLNKGEKTQPHPALIRRLVDQQYERNDADLSRGKFRVRGDTLDLLPAYEEVAVQVQFWGDEVDRIVEIDPLTGEVFGERDFDCHLPRQALRHVAGEAGACHPRHRGGA